MGIILLRRLTLKSPHKYTVGFNFALSARNFSIYIVNSVINSVNKELGSLYIAPIVTGLNFRLIVS